MTHGVKLLLDNNGKAFSSSLMSIFHIFSFKVGVPVDFLAFIKCFAINVFHFFSQDRLTSTWYRVSCGYEMIHRMLEIKPWLWKVLSSKILLKEVFDPIVFCSCVKSKSWTVWNLKCQCFTWTSILNIIAVSLWKMLRILVSFKECCLFLVVQVFYSVVNWFIVRVSRTNLHTIIQNFY